MKCDGARAETRFPVSAKRTGSFTSAGASVQSTTGSRGVRIRGNNAGYAMFRGSAKSTGYPLHSPVSPSLPLLCVTVCYHISTEVYQHTLRNNTEEQRPYLHRAGSLKSREFEFNSKEDNNPIKRILNRLTPNDPHMGRTAPLTSKHCTLYIYSTNVGTEYFKHALYSPFFSSKCSLFHNANLFGSCIIHILHTGCA